MKKQKLQQINFSTHPAFKQDSTLTFFDKSKELKNLPSFIFLTGENGAGKTSILDFIYLGLGATEHRYSISVETGDFKGKISLFDGSQFLDIDVTVEEGRITSNFDAKDLKIIYNKVDVSFKKEKITGLLTALGKDSPREDIIPQLLVNIKSEDDALFADYYRDNGKAPKDYKRKLDRFTDAFEKMFDGTKTFKTVKDEDGELKIMFTDSNDKPVELSTFSTGEKQIIYRVGHLLKDLENLDNAFILIDEPETSLHPKWQKKYVQYLRDVFDGLDIQFFIATHSPYILQGINQVNSICYKIDRNNSEIGEKVGFYKNMIGSSPSINLINYKVYDIVDELLHIELFTALDIKYGGFKKIKLNMNSDSQIRKVPDFTASVGYPGCKIGDIVSEALPISIRNKIHHADELSRPNYTEDEIRESIEIMLTMLTK
jgi:predicted ATPase